MIPAIHQIRRLIPGLTIMLGLVGCNGTERAPERFEVPTDESPASVEELLDLADSSRGAIASSYLIQASELLVEAGALEEAAELIESLDPQRPLDDESRLRMALVRSDIDLAMRRPQQALDALRDDVIDEVTEQGGPLRQRFFLNRSVALIELGRYSEAVGTLLTQLPAEIEDGQRRQDLIWSTLQRLTDGQLASLAAGANSYELRGWIELTRSMRNEQYSLPRQLEALTRWQGVWNRHSAVNLRPAALQRLDQVWNQRPRQVALLLPLQDQIGRAVQEGFLSAYYQTLELGEPVPAISVYDTSGVTEIRGLYDTAVAAGAELIIGPLNKELVRQLDNLERLPVPTLALNYTDFESRNSPAFYQFGLAPEDEILQMARLARASGYQNAAIVAPDNVDYRRLQQEFTRMWENLGGRVVSTVGYTGDGEFSDTVKRLLAIDASESRAARIEALLPRSGIEFTPRRRGDIDFLFLMANPRQGRQIKPTLAFYFAGDLPVFALSAINDGSSNQRNNQDLDGIIFSDSPWVLNRESAFKLRVNESLRSTQGPLQRLRALGIDSFRLYSRLGQLATGELVNFPGATGQLSMTASGVIERVPQTARFVDGQATLIDAPLPPGSQAGNF